MTDGEAENTKKRPWQADCNHKWKIISRQTSDKTRCSVSTSNRSQSLPVDNDSEYQTKKNINEAHPKTQDTEPLSMFFVNLKPKSNDHWTCSILKSESNRHDTNEVIVQFEPFKSVFREMWITVGLL